MVENRNQIKSGKTMDVDVRKKNLRQHYLCKKDYIWNPATCTCKRCKYLAIIIDL